MLKATITVSATSYDELVYALDEVKNHFQNEMRGGTDPREDGITSYYFDVQGEESPHVVCEHCGYHMCYEGAEPSVCIDCRVALKEGT